MSNGEPSSFRDHAGEKVTSTSSALSPATSTASGPSAPADVAPGDDRILAALRKYAPTDPDAAKQMRHACRVEDPDCTDAEIVEVIHFKAKAIKPDTSSPIGLLLKSVPGCFSGGGFARRRAAAAAAAATAASAKLRRDAEIRRDAQATLSDPRAEASEKDLARELLNQVEVPGDLPAPQHDPAPRNRQFSTAADRCS